MRQSIIKHHHKISWLVLAMGCYFNMGCAPIYRTHYSFTPPPTAEGKICASQCNSDQLHCKQMEDLIYETCQLRSERAYHYNRICNYDKKHREDKKHRDCHTPFHYYQPICITNYSRCKTQYRSCYKACGGTITAQKICVLGC